MARPNGSYVKFIYPIFTHGCVKNSAFTLFTKGMIPMDTPTLRKIRACSYIRLVVYIIRYDIDKHGSIVTSANWRPGILPHGDHHT